MGTYVSLGILIDGKSTFTTQHQPTLDGTGVITTVALGGGDRADLQTTDPEAFRALARCLLTAALEHDRLTGAAVAGEPHRAMGQVSA